MSKPINPIHWECFVTNPPSPAGVVDLRTLPEEIKVSIIQAALNVACRYDNGDFIVEEDTEESLALTELAEAVNGVRKHMFQVNLTLLPREENP